MEQILKELNNKLDAVFYSAVYYGPRRVPFLEASEEDWKQQLNVNLYGLWFSLLLTLPILKQHSPSLFVHMTSDVVYNAGPWRAGYAATKAAASNLMDSLVKEAPEGHVRLVQLIPGKMIDTSNLYNRCPSNFKYKYDGLSKHLQQAALQLLQTRGEGMHGKSLVFDEHGHLLRLDDAISDE